MTIDRRSGQGQPDALTLLHAEHAMIVASLDDLAEGRWRARTASKKLVTICNAIHRHAQIERELLYPALRGRGDDDVLDSARVEHRTMEELIGELLNGKSRDGLRAARIEALAMYAAHHFRDEEEQLFPLARNAGIDLAALGRRMESRAAELETVDYPVCRARQSA